MIALAKTILTTPRIMYAGIFFISVFSLLMALIAEHVFGLKPCILCLFQRAPFVAAAVIALLSFWFTEKLCNKNLEAWPILISSLIFLCGGIIAFYHTGVELHWWISFLEGCKVNFDTNDVASLLANIEMATAVPCDEIPWADPIFNLSMANYNVMFSLGLSAACALSGYLLSTAQTDIKA